MALVSTDLPRCDGCGQERADVREVTFQRVKDGQWYTAMWCADCRESADASMGPGGAWDGEQVYAMRVVGP